METITKTYQLTASEFEWQISTDVKVKAWGFNESVPGPSIKANKGDTVIVKVKNELREPTIIHWHGVRLQSQMDGTGETQQPIMPGEEFEYRFVVPDAGTFWYHSHHNETEQMERGMYGSLIVHDPADPVFDDEKIFMIDDMKLLQDGSFKKGNAIARWIERHDGREGDTVLINGKQDPIIEIPAGHMERWRFINASSARYFHLYLGGRQFKIIGSDGGLIREAVIADRVLIVPGERVEIIGGPFEEGDLIEIQSLPYDRTTFVKQKLKKFATISVTGRRASIANVPDVLRDIEPLAQAEAPINRKVKLSVGASLKHGIDFLINNKVHANDQPVEVGQLQVWEVHNSSLMDHPFHLHGFFFQVLEINGKKVANDRWKDTLNLTPRTRIKIAWMPDNRPGKWMYHCHILEHHEAGMMANFSVVAPGEKLKSDDGHHHHSCNVK